MRQLPDQGLLCLLWEIRHIDPTLVDLTSIVLVSSVPACKLIYIVIHSRWSLA